MKRIAFGGLITLLGCNGSPPLVAPDIIPSSVPSYAIPFSSNSCLKWGRKNCVKATYFCSIHGELVLFEKPVFYEEASQECALRNGFLSKFEAKACR